jgi:putative ABC transport system permease protein
MLLNYFKIAWRTLSKNKLYTTINVLGLSLGICACLVIYLITSFELSYDKFHPEKERIFRVVADRVNPSGEHRKLGFMTDPMAMTIRAEISGLETVAGFYDYYSKISIPEGEKIVRQYEQPKYSMHSDVIIADPEYFDIFKYQWLTPFNWCCPRTKHINISAQDHPISSSAGRCCIMILFA